MGLTYARVKRGYNNLWNKSEVEPHRRAALQRIVRKLSGNKQRYKSVSILIGCPWWWIAIVHNLESGANFGTHLHNGDPLTRRTRRVPAGRPTTGSPPFTWEQSALDALRYKGLHKVPSWEIERCLWEWERYNGLGYFYHKVNSPYLWSFTDLYTRGKYVADGKFSRTAVSQQAGAAAILKEMIAMGEVELDKEVNREETAMSDLTERMDAMQALAPTVSASLHGPLFGLALKALAQAFNADKQEPSAILKKIEEVDFKGLTESLNAAEELLSQVIPQEKPPAATPGGGMQLPEGWPETGTPPTPKPKPDVEPGKIDLLFPKGMTGYKTIIGIVLFGIAWFVESTGVGGSLLNPVILEVIQVLGGVLGVTGFVAKLDRYADAAVKSLQGNTPAGS